MLHFIILLYLRCHKTFFQAGYNAMQPWIAPYLFMIIVPQPLSAKVIGQFYHV